MQAVIKDKAERELRRLSPEAKELLMNTVANKLSVVVNVPEGDKFAAADNARTTLRLLLGTF